MYTPAQLKETFDHAKGQTVSGVPGVIRLRGKLPGENLFHVGIQTHGNEVSGLATL